ncbi:hypothetical protein FBU30_004096 [Linnemannia zychae]|nr:hypothetical protein FBU30_004096 [Linnemannia zychae]
MTAKVFETSCRHTHRARALGHIGYLENQVRADYLHPIAKNGILPWMKMRENRLISNTSFTSTNNYTTNSANWIQEVNKRPSTISASEQEHFIRELYTRYSDDKTKAYTTLLEHLEKYRNSSRMMFYVDGAPALEKQETHCRRNEKLSKALNSANIPIEKLKECTRNDKRPIKQMYRDVEKGFRRGFKWSHQDRGDFVGF